MHHCKFQTSEFPIIDFIVVNLYPFDEIIKTKSSYNECINNIDIGGPTLLRAAAKNYHSVTTVSDINDYKILVNNLNMNL